MKWKCKRYEIVLNKTELLDLRAILRAARRDSPPSTWRGIGGNEVLRQIESHLHPETRLWNELSVRARSMIYCHCRSESKQEVREAIESGEAATWRNCGPKTIAELAAWCEASVPSVSKTKERP